MPKLLLTAQSTDRGNTLLTFLSRRLNLSRKKAKRLLDARRVFVNGRRVWMARHTLRKNDRVEVQEAPSAPGAAEVETVYEDNRFLVVNKPAGSLSNGPQSVEATLRERRHAPHLTAAHRLDRDTSGCLILACGEQARRDVVRLFRQRMVNKVYHAIAMGRLADHAGSVRIPLDGQLALTRFEVLDRSREASHLKLTLHTGRTHQIRKHLARLGHPVLGDKRYATGHLSDERFRHAPRQMLHAARVAFRDPATARVIRASAPLPSDFRACLRALRLT